MLISFRYYFDWLTIKTGNDTMPISVSKTGVVSVKPNDIVRTKQYRQQAQAAKRIKMEKHNHEAQQATNEEELRDEISRLRAKMARVREDLTTFRTHLLSPSAQVWVDKMLRELKTGGGDE